MATYIVRQGDCLRSLAARAGVTVEEILRHADNAELRRRRPDPGQLLPGDRVHLPERAQTAGSLQPGGRHSFRGAMASVLLRLRLQAMDGSPLATTDYAVEVNGRTLEGRTDGEGMLVEVIPSRTRHVLVRTFNTGSRDRPLLWSVDVGSLDPSDEPSGAAHRLRNLGFLRGGAHEASLRSAVTSFQRRAGLEPTGDLDDTTRRALVREHDGP